MVDVAERDVRVVAEKRELTPTEHEPDCQQTENGGAKQELASGESG
jgi:hypothetical protein